MESGEYSAPPSAGLALAESWQATLVLGVVSLIAGIVVAATPTTSLTVLAALLGIWFIIMGIFEIIGGLMLRRLVRSQEAAPTGSAVRAGS